LPEGKSEDMMRLEESATFSALKGSPLKIGRRTTEPSSSLMASGRASLVMKPSATPLRGQFNHSTDFSFRRLPTGKLSAETRTLIVGSFTTVSTSWGACVPDMFIASRPARPAATTATVKMMMRAGFIAMSQKNP